MGGFLLSGGLSAAAGTSGRMAHALAAQGRGSICCASTVRARVQGEARCRRSGQFYMGHDGAKKNSFTLPPPPSMMKDSAAVAGAGISLHVGRSGHAATM